MTQAPKTSAQGIQPVILSGGVGSRLWPLSRALRPKQFLSLRSEQTLFQETVKRVEGGAFGPALVVCNHEHRFLDELEKHRPAIIEACRRAVAGGERDLDFFRLAEDAYGAAESISVDYAVMEPTEDAAVVPTEIGWTDVGAWTALWETGDADANGNVTVGDVMTHGVKGSYIRSDKPFVAAVGVEDLIVVATDDAVLVVAKDRAQDVRVVSEWLKDQGRAEFDISSRVYRPWGFYQIIDSGEKFQAKQLMLNPGAKLSLQRHEKRAEHWVVVEGTATVTRGDDIFTLEANQSTYIPIGVEHRLENAGQGPLRLIEVQSGNYLGEDDIERLEDVYGRS